MKSFRRLMIVIALIAVKTANAQVLNQDAEGNSSIVYEGASIGLDLTKTRLNFSYSNLGLSSTKSERYRLVWGLNASGENSDGLANLFNRGDFQPEAKLNGFLGYRYRIDKKPASLAPIEDRVKELRKEREDAYAKIKSLSKLEEINKEEAKIKELDERIKSLQSNRVELNKTRVRKLVLGYLKAGRTASSFKLASENPSQEGFRTKFENNNFLGGFYGIGVNYEHGRFLIGFSGEYEFTNNLSDLSKITYTLTTTETFTNQTLVSKKEISAYSGNFSKYERVNYNTDLIMFSQLDEDKRNYIAWNLYVRHRVSRDENIVPTYTDLGLGAYFFNVDNKFLGGIYLEAPDFTQKLENAKETPNFRDLEGRLTFGVVAKFNFSSIVAPSF